MRICVPVYLYERHKCLQWGQRVSMRKKSVGNKELLPRKQLCRSRGSLNSSEKKVRQKRAAWRQENVRRQACY